MSNEYKDWREDTIHGLVAKYNDLIQRDHHKDRDCHFFIQRNWSYGQQLGWSVVHYGYCNREGDEGESKFFPSYQAAEDHMVFLLKAWIAIEEEQPIEP